MEQNKKGYLKYYIGIVLILFVIYFVLALNATIPSLSPVYLIRNKSLNLVSSNLVFPNFGESAVGENKLGVLISHGPSTLLPMASTAKLVTALMVLKKYPLTINQQGPMIPITTNDLNIYNNYVAKQGSVVKVVAGESLSEYQMLEAMLLPSADNIADSLAIWAYGSLANYSTLANQYLIDNKIYGVHVGIDASGYDPSSVASASGLILLGIKAYSNPVIAQLVSLKTVPNFPVVGEINNLNFLLGQNGIEGIKTGNNNQDGGIFISESNQVINNTPIKFFTAVLGAPTLWYALNGSLNLVKSIQNNFSNVNQSFNLNNDAVVGYYYQPWNKQKDYIEIKRLNPLMTWNNSKTTLDIKIADITLNEPKNLNVGSITLKNNFLNQSEQISLYLKNSIKKPPLWWLLIHPKLVF